MSGKFRFSSQSAPGPPLALVAPFSGPESKTNSSIKNKTALPLAPPDSLHANAMAHACRVAHACSMSHRSVGSTGEGPNEFMIMARIGHDQNVIGPQAHWLWLFIFALVCLCSSPQC